MACRPVLYHTTTTRKAATIERNQSTRINDQIRISPLRVISDDGTPLGIIERDDALSKAREAGLDLVEVAPNERPPVCRIMDFGKYKYDKKKKQNQGRFFPLLVYKVN